MMESLEKGTNFYGPKLTKILKVWQNFCPSVHVKNTTRHKVAFYFIHRLRRMASQFQRCIFRSIYRCKSDEPLQKNCENNRLDSIIQFSKRYGDNLHLDLEKQIPGDVWYHKNCVSRYTSPNNVPKAKELHEPPNKKLRSCQKKPFNFEHDCLYCGEECDVTKPKKNPTRWRKAYLCKATVSATDHRPYKDYILSLCRQRDDEWGNEVEVRLQGAISDLSAAGARYHKDCVSRFMTTTQRKATPKKVGIENLDFRAMELVISAMESERTRIWDSVELYKIYQQNARKNSYTSRHAVIETIRRHFKDEIQVLSSPGCPLLLAFSPAVAKVMYQAKEKQDMPRKDQANDITHHIKKVAKQVQQECELMNMDMESYNMNCTFDQAQEQSSPVLVKLLSAISPKLEGTLPAVMIGNVVTGTVCSKPTDLQIMLGVLLRESKANIKTLKDYGITCSYDEVLRFKKSAAAAAVSNIDRLEIQAEKSTMIQVVVDNFDADIASQNGKVSTHSLAMILTQNERTDSGSNESAVSDIDRLSRAERRLPIDEEVEVVQYIPKQKKPPMTPMTDLRHVEPPKNCERARATDFQFLKDILTSETCPEFGGYNVKKLRTEGTQLSARTQVAYLPLIDSIPSSPSTMYTAMLRSLQVCERLGQHFAVMTADMQLYKVAVHIMWENEIDFRNLHLRLGGMHLLMSYIGCIGSLMAGSGLEEILGAAFAGVPKLLSGKKFPQNVRALRLLTEELLRPVFEMHPEMQSLEDMRRILDDMCTGSRTARLWVTVVVYPMLTILKFIRAEREGDWMLHLSAVEEMLPLFFAASHINYARYAFVYLRQMQQLPDEINQHFLKGEHTFYHQPGLFNGIWSDMAIETTYMRYGHGSSGIIGLTLNADAVKVWAYSMYACSKVSDSIEQMRNHLSNTPKSPNDHHKEEAPGRMKMDSEDREALQKKLQLCIHPLRDCHEASQQHLNNVATGEVLNQGSINVDQAVSLGIEAMNKFESGWPNSFHAPIKKVVSTMDAAKKHIQIERKKVFDPEVIYARAMALQSTNPQLTSHTLLAHELSPVPSSMFTKEGMREATKAVLKNKLQVLVDSSDPETTNFDGIFVDGCALMWTVHWPTGKTVGDFLICFFNRLQDLLKRCTVYLLFDWLVSLFLMNSAASFYK